MWFLWYGNGIFSEAVTHHQWQPCWTTLDNFRFCYVGKRLHFAMERSTIFNGKIHELSMAIFNSKLLNYQRVDVLPCVALDPMIPTELLTLSTRPVSKVDCVRLQPFGTVSFVGTSNAKAEVNRRNQRLRKSYKIMRNPRFSFWLCFVVKR